MTVKSKFFSDHPGKIYLEEAAVYLADRGCTVEDLKLVGSHQKDHGLLIRAGKEYAPYLLEGFAFRVKGPDGEYHDGSFLFRPCNWPDEPLYWKVGGEVKLFKDRPKFLHVGDHCINWVSTLNECSNAVHLAIHEKYTCAALSAKYLHIPSIALSGCCNWSKNGKLHPDLRRLFLTMTAGATVYICFDGDLRSNPLVLHASQSLKGWVEALRPDLKVVFPQVPEGYNGWDDWAVTRPEGSVAVEWLRMLEGQGIDISGFIPVGVLIDQYGLAFKTVKERVKIAHTASNYSKIVALHPEWEGFGMNIDDQVYNINDPRQPMEFKALGTKVEIWMANCVFPGGEGESVSHPKIVRAIEDIMDSPDREFSIPHRVIRSFGAPPTEDQARAAVEKLFSLGIKVTGPMDHGELVETFLRIMRDMVGMWSHDTTWSPQWMLGIIGPSGAGKSDFFKSLLRCMSDSGVQGTVGTLHTTGDKAKPEEMNRIVNASLIGQLDEYNPPSSMGKAKEFEDLILSIVSSRFTMLRRMRENNPKPLLRNASIVLTTTDKNRQFLRSGKDEGAERRAIVIEVAGLVVGPDGKMTSNRKIVSECGRILIPWGLWAYENQWQVERAATEFSMKYASQYLEEDDTLRNVGKFWARGRPSTDLDARGKLLYREGTKDWRLSPTQLYEMLFPGEKLTREQGTKLKALALECGAVEIGKARVNSMTAGERETMVDRVLSIENWVAWCDGVRGKLGA